MLTIFTGGPGAGKTAALVDLLLDLPGDRPVFNDGLNELVLPGREVLQLDAMQWHKEVPDGAIIVIDEVQRRWRPRGPSSAVPEAIAALETHRHRGVDIFVTTQAPRLVDSNVRSLCTRHVHIRDTGWAGRYWYEWPEVSENISWKNCVNKRKYKLPIRAYKHYKSASLHTKAPRKTPKMLYVAMMLVLLVLVLVFLAYRTFTRAAPVPESKAPGQTTPTIFSSSAVQPGGAARPIDDRVDWIPRISSRPETAPAYDQLRQVKVMPRIAAGYVKGKEVRCYTQQGTRAELSDQECRAWLASPPFDPYREQLEVKAPQVDQPKISEPPQLGGVIAIDGAMDRPARTVQSTLGAKT